jgi:hypothetical protein
MFYSVYLMGLGMIIWNLAEKVGFYLESIGE